MQCNSEELVFHFLCNTLCDDRITLKTFKMKTASHTKMYIFNWFYIAISFQVGSKSLRKSGVIHLFVLCIVKLKTQKNVMNSKDLKKKMSMNSVA